MVDRLIFLHQESSPVMQTPAYITEFLEWLMGFINYEAFLNKYTGDNHIFSLEPIRDLTKRLGSPEKAVPSIHIAGSKGKGSVAKMLGCILDEATGGPISIFASPHVYDFRERICSARGFFPDEIYQKSIAELKNTVERDHLTEVSWHELTTAFGFLCAKNISAKYAVVETGCGGRLDATNIIEPELTIINRIELEHTALLGDTLEKIAVEKAGIIKPGVTVLVSKQAKASVSEVFQKRADQLSAPICFVEEVCEISKPRYQNSKMHVEVFGEFFQRPLQLELKILGEKQAENAALAALAAKILLPEIPETEIERGLGRASLAGRFEERGNVILDGAHTPASVEQALDTLNELYPNQKHHLLFSSVAGKDLKHIVPQFRGKFEKVYLTVPGSTKDVDIEELKQIFRENEIEFTASEDYEQIIKTALEDTAANEKLLAIGSFYLLEKVARQI